ncbi:hypothetical protein CGZ93_13920 [Enemella dayhoffiae]|uniref:Uncharacterized protein n=1 Tax=Enemella dayhoffiae TaxID=2016507 RepID=A0A255GVE7_9ACTN|nr:hypothetical protein CGZ93_13920 [Enemella dayhoffiae]
MLSQVCWIGDTGAGLGEVGVVGLPAAVGAGVSRGLVTGPERAADADGGGDQQATHHRGAPEAAVD